MADDPVAEELAEWLPDPALHVVHRHPSDASAEELWAAARRLRLADAPVLGRLIGWRIPGVARDLPFDRLFREPPFLVLAEHEHGLLSGLVGRIWTLRRDYPELAGPGAFAEWSQRGTARVAIATWVRTEGAGAALCSEARVQALGLQGQLGVAAVRPLVRSFSHLISSEAQRVTVRRAEGRDTTGERRRSAAETH